MPPKIEDGMSSKERYFAKKKREASLIECACGCGALLLEFDDYGRKRQFVSGHNNSTGRQSKEALRAAQQKYRTHNKDKIKNEKRKAYRLKKIALIAVLGGKCSLCGIPYNGTNAPIFEFHHPNPDSKLDGVTRIMNKGTMEAVLNEAHKCILVCANCHNQHHGGEW